jgi:hypothetical protein
MCFHVIKTVYKTSNYGTLSSSLFGPILLVVCSSFVSQNTTKCNAGQFLTMTHFVAKQKGRVELAVLGAVRGPDLRN